MKTAHGVEVGGERLGVSSFQLLDEAMDVGCDDVLGGLPLLPLFRVFADGGEGGGLHGCFLLGFGCCTSALKRGMYMPNATWRRRG